MKRNIYTTSAKDYYDNAPMMDMYYLCANKNKSHSYRTDIFTSENTPQKILFFVIPLL